MFKLKLYHHGLGVSPQRILKQTGQFGVSVGDVSALAVHQGGDNVTQGGEGQIDLRCFLQTLTCGSSFALSF